MRKRYKRLTLEMRYKIKEMHEQNCSIRMIAEALEVSPGTIHYELRRAKDGNYDPEYAEQQYQERRQGLGREAIIATNENLAEFIAEKIKDGYSPEKIANILKCESSKKGGLESVSINTIYRAIDIGLIPGITRESLRLGETKMFSNGMVCVPKWIRQELELNDGDIFCVSLLADGKIVLKKKVATEVDESM